MSSSKISENISIESQQCASTNTVFNSDSGTNLNSEYDLLRGDTIDSSSDDESNAGPDYNTHALVNHVKGMYRFDFVNMLRDIRAKKTKCMKRYQITNMLDLVESTLQFQQKCTLSRLCAHIIHYTANNSDYMPEYDNLHKNLQFILSQKETDKQGVSRTITSHALTISATRKNELIHHERILGEYVITVCNV